MFFDLYHYYENDIGPFINLSDLTISEAKDVQGRIKDENKTFAALRLEDYLEKRFEFENIAREIFINKGGEPVRERPHYMVVEECDWLKTWYINGKFVKLSVKEFDHKIISFTYGDMFPTFGKASTDGKEYRKQVYTYSEITQVIDKYGLPQVWNNDGRFGPERYIEAQVWSNDPIKKYLQRSC